MSGPSWLAGIFAGVMVLVASYCVARLVIAAAWHRPTEHEIDVVHAVMGIAMAGRLAGGLKLLPGSAWAVVFSAGTAWFAWQLGRAYLSQHGAQWPHHLPHLIMCGAMVYMLLVVTPAGAGSGDTGGLGGSMAMSGAAPGPRFTIFTLILAVFFCGYAVWETDRLPRLARVGGGRVPVTVTAFASAGETRTATADGAAGTAAAGTGGTPARTAARAISPRLASCRQIAMAVTMGYMLVMML